jgi:hypothetical protein
MGCVFWSENRSDVFLSVDLGHRAAVAKAKADLHNVCNDFSNFITDSINFYQVRL